MTIREATATDRPRLLEMGARFHSTTPYGRLLRWDAEKVGRLIDLLLTPGVGAFFVAEGRAGDLEGVVGVFLSQHPMTGDLLGSELCLWMEPEARGGSTAIRLVRRAEAWAQAQGAVGQQLVAPNEQVGRFYRRLGYAPIETVFMRTF